MELARFVRNWELNAGYLLVDVAASYKPVPVMEVHGINDPTVSYQPGQQVGAVANFQRWTTHNGCTGSAVETWRQGNNFVQTYKSCKGSTEVSLMTIGEGRPLPIWRQGGDHP